MNPLVLSMLLSMCGTFMSVHAGDEVVCVNPVDHAGNTQRMSQGGFSANAQRNDFNLTANSIGYGLAADREY
jgi:hypothetical protein